MNLTTNKSASRFLYRVIVAGLMSVFIFPVLVLYSTTSRANNNNEVPFHAVEDSDASDALVDFQRTILMSKHRIAKTPAVTTENVTTYRLPSAAIIPLPREIRETPHPVNYILNRSVNLPHNAEAQGVSVKNGTITFSSGN